VRIFGRDPRVALGEHSLTSDDGNPEAQDVEIG
jgi:hypothetical protein